ncbi:MAG: hypothetical protein OEZ06_03960 [Myxococcales bacterium]|nr:hypothetical protein [Myxococcales bacterium]
MRHDIVLTVIGPDRPGLVQALSDTVASHRGNWEESRMAHLSGRFAGILRLSVAAEDASALQTALQQLEARGLRVIAEVEAPNAPTPDAAGARRLQLEVVGNDRQGIVREVAHALASRAVNVERLETRCEDAPMGGGQIFRARALLQVPAQLSLQDLREVLEALADDLMVDLLERPGH